jgi:hypothetical protein
MSHVASVGLVDAVRVGDDEGIDLWDPSIIHNQTAWNFTNHILWQNDPGCIYLSEKLKTKLKRVGKLGDHGWYVRRSFPDL